MKTKHFFAIGMISIVLFVGGCGQTSKVEMEAQRTETEEIVNENQEEEPIVEEEPEVVYETIDLQSDLGLDFAEMSVEKVYINDYTMSGIPMHPVTYEEPSAGSYYLGISGQIKNTLGKPVTPTVNGQILVDEKYTYDLEPIFIIDGLDKVTDIAPIKACRYYLYAVVPKELVETYSTAELKLAFMDNFDSLEGDLDTATHRFSINLGSSPIGDKEFSLGETSSIGGLEYRVLSFGYGEKINNDETKDNYYALWDGHTYSLSYMGDYPYLVTEFTVTNNNNFDFFIGDGIIPRMHVNDTIIYPCGWEYVVVNENGIEVNPEDRFLHPGETKQYRWIANGEIKFGDEDDIQLWFTINKENLHLKYNPEITSIIDKE